MQLVKAFLPFCLILVTGVFGYHWIEGWSLFDGLYMTMVTLTTVGFGETHELSTQGRVFTLTLLVFGVSNFAYLVRVMSLEFINPLVTALIKEKRMTQNLEHIQGHFIICGYGRIGKDVVAGLKKAGKPVVVIDAHAAHKADLDGMQIPFIEGDASHEEVLEKAGIRRANGLVSAVRSEAENVFITLTAREMKADLFIISRYEEESTKKKLLRAGANRVINPYHIGSQKISQILLQPTTEKLLDFSEHPDFNLVFEEMELRPGHRFLGLSLQETKLRERFNVIIVAVEKSAGNIISNPGATYCLEPGDRLVMIAEQKEMNHLLTSLQGGTHAP